MEETSAINCGLEEGDVLTAVDGNNITHLPAADASHLLSGKFNSQVRGRWMDRSAEHVIFFVPRTYPHLDAMGCRGTISLYRAH